MRRVEAWNIRTMKQDALVAAEREITRRLNLTIKEGQKIAMHARQVLREAGAPRQLC